MSDTPSRLKIFSCRPTAKAEEESCATDIIKQYSELKADHVDGFAAVLAELETRGPFAREGDQLTAPTRVVLAVTDWLEWMHSTSTLARVRLGDRAADFDRDMTALFARLGVSEFEFAVQGRIVWGRPVAIARHRRLLREETS